MKRLVNAYSVSRALATLTHIDIERDQLALWTILSLRWPQLAEYLEERPEMVEKIGQQDVTDVIENLQALFHDQEVVSVITAECVNAVLDREVVDRCARLRS